MISAHILVTKHHLSKHLNKNPQLSGLRERRTREARTIGRMQ